MTDKKDECIKVVVRIRPLNSEEKRNGNQVCAEAFSDQGLIVVKSIQDQNDAKNFSFDAVFSPTCTQREIYDTCAAGVVESVLNGYNGTIFAYGQVITFIAFLHVHITLFNIGSRLGLEKRILWKVNKILPICVALFRTLFSIFLIMWQAQPNQCNSLSVRPIWKFTMKISEICCQKTLRIS